MANYPKKLPRMQCAEGHIGSITGLWLLPDRPLGLNTNEWIEPRTKLIIYGYALLGYYVVSSAKFVPTFRDTLSVSSSGVKDGIFDPWRWDR